MAGDRGLTLLLKVLGPKGHHYNETVDANYPAILDITPIPFTVTVGEKEEFDVNITHY